MPPASNTEIAFPFVDARIYGTKSTFSDAAYKAGGVKAKDDAYLIGENSEQQVRHYQQDKNVFWQTFMDYAINHPEILSGFMSEFLQDSNADIFGVFPIKLSKEAVFYKTEIRIEPQLPTTSTRKVPGRNIHFQTNMRKGTAEYTGQGFSNDYHFLRTPEGMQWFDRMASAVISDIWLMIIHSALKEFQAVPSGYNQPDQLYPNDEVPLTVEALFDYEQSMFCPLNKGPQQIHNLIARISRIFERNQNDRVRKIITTMDTLHFINVRDETNLYYDKSGSQAISNRALGNAVTTLHGVEVVPVQMLEPSLHSDVTDNVLRNVVVNGGMTVFPQRYLELDPKEYRSVYRDIKFSSWTSDKVEVHPFIDMLNHCFEFHPLNSQDCRETEQGWLNYHLLNSLGDAALGKAGSDIKNPFDSTRTLQQGNENRLHQFLDYVPVGLTIQAKDKLNFFKTTKPRYDPVFFFSQIDECHMKQRYFDFTIKTIENQLSKALFPSELAKLEKFNQNPGVKSLVFDVELAKNNKEVVEINNIMKKLASRAAEICKDNFYSAVLSAIAEPINILDKNTLDYFFSALGQPFNNALDSLWETEETYEKNQESIKLTGFPLFPNTPSGNAARAYHDGKLNAISAAYSETLKDYKLKYDMAVSSISGHVMTQKTNAKISQTGKLLEKMSVMLANTQFITLRGINAWADHDIAVPLGGRMFRPFETQFAESMPMLAEGQIGNTFFSGLDNTIQFDQSTQHFQTQIFTYFKVWIDKRDKFYMAPFVRGLQLLGGKGNKYINYHPNLGGIVTVGSAAWNEMMGDIFGDMYSSVGEKLGDYSMIPVLQSLNESVEDDFRKRHLDIRGFWDPEDYVSRLHQSESFNAHRRAQPMYDNQFLINHIFPQFTTAHIQPLDRPTASFNDITSRRRMNFAVHQTTQYYTNEQTLDWDKTNSSHQWGDEEDGIVGIQSSSSAVTLKEPFY